MPVCPPRIVRWVSRHIIPQEPQVRTSLQRSGLDAADIDDLVQEAYCKLAALRSVDHIERPGAYFMQVVKNLRLDALRRAQVVRFEDYTESTASCVEDRASSVDAMMAARQEVLLIEKLLATLPDRCREVFTLKRIEGLSQREIATRLGVTENVVENDVQKALRLIQKALRSEDQQEAGNFDGPRRKIG